MLAMDWSAIGSASTAIGVLVALAAVVSSLVATRRSEQLTRDGQQLQREQADAAAARSEAAAALTEEYTRRVVLALEEMAESGLDAGGVRPTPRGVVWSLTHYGGDTYLLRNDGNVDAEAVSVGSHETLSLIYPQPFPDRLAPGEGGTFMAAVSMGTRDTTITVTWSDAGSAETKTWRYPLPPRPPRTPR
jgi:hypothetical protein